MYPARLTYLLLFPAKNLPSVGQPKTPVKPKDAPYFFDLDIEVMTVAEWHEQIANQDVSVTLRLVDHQVMVAEALYQLPDGFEKKSVEFKEQLNHELRLRLLKKYQITDNLVEEYSILLLPKMREAINHFVEKHRPLLARFIRTTTKPLDAVEIKNTLLSQIHYSESDLTIIDWEGAVVCSSGNDFVEDIDLFIVGNYQLLRYRMLDASIERALKRIRQALSERKSFFWGHTNATLEKVVRSQLSLLLDFERTNQSLLLIGDWYSAKMFRTIVEEFYIDDWKEVVSNKLQSLSSIDETVRQNLTLSWSRLLDFMQIGGWLIILIGYFVLFIHDMIGAK